MEYYEKKYKEALVNARQEYNTTKNVERKQWLEELFPELKPSEDERIRKAIIDIIKFQKEQQCHIDGAIYDEMVAWLEKQVSPNIVADAYLRGCNDTEKKLLEKQRKKVEPKFKVGDWVVQENIGVYKVIEICESWYEVIDFEDNHYSISFDKEYMCHLWTIDDAKDGDVLCDYCEGWDNPLIFVLKKFEHVNFGLVRPSDYSSYCYLTAGDRQRFKEGTYHHKHSIKPATKEQRGLLFSKIKEAGCEWDDDKKELKRRTTK